MILAMLVLALVGDTVSPPMASPTGAPRAEVRRHASDVKITVLSTMLAGDPARGASASGATPRWWRWMAAGC
ncbi:MAG: hypothetical protein U5K74_07790 [Gemmatimonadaceae bacterium]|nr:hypothetical protein [Gemmatimonadaceae bacterium]